MSNDLECPYCGEYNEVCHDDGAGYHEHQRHEMQCDACDNYFVFTTAISFDYTPAKADCLNGKPHRLCESKTYPKWRAKMVCQDCDYSERLPAERMVQLLAEEEAIAADKETP